MVFPSNNPNSHLENKDAIQTKFEEREENDGKTFQFPITFSDNNNQVPNSIEEAEAILYARGVKNVSNQGGSYNPKLYAGKNVTLDIFVESDSYGKPNIRHNNTQDHFHLWSKVLAVLQKMEANKMASLTLRLFNEKGQALDEGKELLSTYLTNCLNQNQNQNQYPKLDGIIGKIPVYIREIPIYFGGELVEIPSTGGYPKKAASKLTIPYKNANIVGVNYKYHRIVNDQVIEMNYEAWKHRIKRGTTVEPIYN